MPASLYLHVPFCPQICPYCDFHKMLRSEELVVAYLERLEEEMAQLAHRFGGPLDTIYLGGGTPSGLGDEELQRIVEALDRAWGFPARLETTLEADPLTFDPTRLQRFADLGFSRLSIGLQSTQDAVLRRLGRAHDGRQGLLALEWALAAGFEVSADVMTAVEGQDTEADLRAVAASGTPHVSVYTLTIEPYTPFAMKGVEVDEEKAADDYELANEVLQQYGLERYEVSSHARPGHESQHNQVYWNGRHFLAVGPSAASFLPSPGTLGRRQSNPPLKLWLRGEQPQAESVEPLDYLLERLMTGLRTRAGIDLVQLHEQTGLNPEEVLAERLTALRRGGLLELDAGRLRASEGGLLRLDAVLRSLFSTAREWAHEREPA